MTIRNFFRVLYAVFGLLLAALATVVVQLHNGQQDLARSQATRYASYLLADQLRQSSDDLTRFARTYVATGDPKYEVYYWAIVDIRNGKRPRPENYERIFWDLVPTGARTLPATGRAVPLRRLMQEAGFTDAEFAKLAEAQKNSDALVRTEEIAMHAMKGEFDDEAGGFTRRGAPNQAMAMLLMNDEAYHRAKAGIMKPIDEFLSMLDTRTRVALDARMARTMTLLWRGVGILGCLVLLGGVSLILVTEWVTRPIQIIQRQTGAVAADLKRLAEVTGEIAKGQGARGFAVEATPLGLKSRDEFGELGRYHDAMLTGLQAASAAIAKIMAELGGRSRALDAARVEQEKVAEQLRLILESVAEAIYGVDADGNCTFCNRACMQMLGYSRPEQLIGKNLHGMVHHAQGDGDSFPAAGCRICRSYQTGEATNADDSVLWRADGTSFPAEYWSYPQRRAGAVVVGAVVTFVDITKRRAIDDELHKHRLHLEEMVAERTLELQEKNLALAVDVAKRKRAEAELHVRLAELERFNRLATERELRVVELKRMVNELAAASGRPAPYQHVAADLLTGKLGCPAGTVQMEEPVASPSTKEYTIDQFIDIPELQKLMDMLYDATGINHALIDNNGKIFTAAGWQRICTKFHRVNPETCAMCIKSDQYISEHLHDGPYVGYRCPHGLTDYAVPLIIEGRHLANLFTGQMFHEPPDLEFFRKQAARYGFDEADYLRAVKEVHIVPKERMASIMSFLTTMAQIVARGGLSRLRELESAEQRNGEFYRQREAALNLAEDATEARKAAEATRLSLHQNEAKLRLLLDSTAEAIYGADLDGHCTFCNPACVRLLGFKSAEEILGKDMHALIHYTYPDGTPLPVEECRLHQSFQKGEGCHLDDELMWRADGTSFAVECWAHPQVENGKVTGSVVAFNDITIRRQAEEKSLQQLDELRRWYAATVNREDRVMELKREVNRLLEQLGAPPKYSGLAPTKKTEVDQL